MARKPRVPAWQPADYHPVHDIEALKALALGKASEGQQVRALKWILEQACQTYELSFRSDADGGDRETAFAEGKRHVGMQIVKLINLSPALVAKLRETNG